MRDSLARPRAAGRGRRVVARGTAFAAVIAVTMLGNLRSQASEVVRAPAPVIRVSASEAVSPTSAPVPQMTSSTAADRANEVTDEVQLVPAIYAWDPDVRFVYFRHVSKWM